MFSRTVGENFLIMNLVFCYPNLTPTLEHIKIPMGSVFGLRVWSPGSIFRKFTFLRDPDLKFIFSLNTYDSISAIFFVVLLMNFIFGVITKKRHEPFLKTRIPMEKS